MNRAKYHEEFMNKFRVTPANEPKLKASKKLPPDSAARFGNPALIEILENENESKKALFHSQTLITELEDTGMLFI